jgi:homoserine kinase
VLLLAMLEALNSDAGFEIEIYKTSKPEAVLGVALPVQQERFWNELLGRPFEIKDLVQFAMQGEKLAWEY